ncbi:hypothetical protein EJD97_000990 [Solanum chilense]|uniref:Ubiquitin-like protease family profile domain-containing protein n=1 Tax=Solanum chilense TaxID=4083 RepID=A0A6N2C5V0_SOLCI|nr:hypothetical protein EJD97_000990 [Solanum chilense]
MDETILNQSPSQHDFEAQETSEKHGVDFEKKYVELKAEIAEDDATHNVAQYTKDPTDKSSVSMDEHVNISNTDDEAQKSTGGFFNVDVPGSSTSKPPALDDYPDFTMTQIIALDQSLNDITTPKLQPRHKNPDKYEFSPYIRLSEGESSSKRVPIFFPIKHPFQSHNGFDISADMIEEFNQWVIKDVSDWRDRKAAYSKVKNIFHPQMDFGVVKIVEEDFFT